MPEAFQPDTGRLAKLLVLVYRNRQVPFFRLQWQQLGFTAESVASPEVLFRMLSLASYDRRPWVDEGYETIWGIRCEDSMRGLLDRGEITLQNVKAWSHQALDLRLQKLMFRRRSIDVDADGYVRYARCLRELAMFVESLTDEQVLSRVASPGDTIRFHERMDAVYGFGPTISSKITQYLFRHIGVGRVNPSDFPGAVVRPILKEYHNAEILKVLACVRPDAETALASDTTAAGEPFAVDALFFLRRHEESWSNARHRAAGFERIYQVMKGVAADNGRMGQRLLEQVEQYRADGNPRDLKRHWERIVLKYGGQSQARARRTLENQYPAMLCAYMEALFDIADGGASGPPGAA